MVEADKIWHMSTEPVSIMIVESQPLMRSALSTALAAEGFKVAESVWNSQTMRTASKLRPDLVLLSVGASSCDDLKSISPLRESLPSALIVALITGEFPGQGQEALDQGAHLVVKKTLSRSALMDTLNKLLKKTQPVNMLAM